MTKTMLSSYIDADVLDEFRDRIPSNSRSKKIQELISEYFRREDAIRRVLKEFGIEEKLEELPPDWSRLKVAEFALRVHEETRRSME